ncbi:MAG: hypothetical protein A3E01_02915 [Gammaproteobacteria bacterium RIFCSPHIGHO2_12_FULL_63_22]|nr:MAG: hypothetical protein A3E01_02915 [Gammaproteobacteria bacterium RIFCSPHIGHO2_12_FULL_63_22]
MAIDGPSGSGKTYTALRCAFALSPSRKVAVIGTEGSQDDDAAEKYVGLPDPDHAGQTWEFDILHLSSFSPTEYTAAIEEACRAGYEVVIVDSLSHAWEGKDGSLELVGRTPGNSYTAWKDVTPMHRRMVDAILNSTAHVICTMRSKTEYILEEQAGKDGKPKQVPRKVGMAPIQRQGMEYEFDIYGSLDWSHILTVTKTRCPSVDGLTVVKAGAGFMAPIIDWLDTGTVTDPPRIAPKCTDDQCNRIVELAEQLSWKIGRVTVETVKKFGCDALYQLKATEADETITWLEGQVRLAANKKPARKPRGAAAATTAPVEANGNGQHDAAEPATVESTTTTEADTSSAITEPAVPSELTDPLNVPITPGVGPHSDQLDQIVALVNDLVTGGMPRETYREKILAKRGVKSAKELTPEQAAELIDALMAAVDRQTAPDGPDDPPF